MQTDASVMDFFFRRVGDAERDACVEILIEHHLQGRLSSEELSHRRDAALKATTAAELAGIVADLPRSTSLSEPVQAQPSTAPAASGTALLAVQVPERVKAWTRVLGPPAAVGLTAWTVTMGIANDAAVQASLVTGAVGCVATWLATRRKHDPPRRDGLR